MRLGCTRRRQGLWTALFSLLLTSTCVLGDDKPCIVHDNGKIYDLNPLKSKTDYQIDTLNGRKLFLNVCQSVKTETFGLKDDSVAPSEIGAFVRRDHGDFSIGKFNTSISVFNSEPRFTMAQGSQCSSTSGNSNSNSRASSLVNLICDPSVSGVGSPQLVGSLPPGDEDAACAFIIEWKTSYACGISETGGFWKFMVSLVVTLLILLTSYTILGTLYNYIVLNLKGLDSIPQFSFQSMQYHISEALEWTKDVLGILLVNYCSSNSGGGRGYDVLPSHHHHHGGSRTPNPVSHHAQVSGIVNGGTHDDDQDQELEQAQEQRRSGGFTRPKPAQLRPTTNPISHHVQAVQSLSQAALSPQPRTPQPQTPPQQTHPQPANDEPAAPQADGQFMLFSDDQDEEEDVAGEISKGPAIQL